MKTLEQLLPIIQEKYPEAYIENEDIIFGEKNQIDKYFLNINEKYEKFILDRYWVYKTETGGKEHIEFLFDTESIIQLKNYLDISITFKDLEDYAKDMMEEHDCLNITKVQIINYGEQEVKNISIFSCYGIDIVKMVFNGDNTITFNYLNSLKEDFVLYKNISFYDMYKILEIKFKELINNK